VRSSSDARILPSIRPFRFAITATRADSGAEWRAKARRIEELGYDTLLVTDHLGPQLAPVPAMAAALEATTRLRVGSYVFANDYRNPMMLAKEIATMDAATLSFNVPESSLPSQAGDSCAEPASIFDTKFS